MHGVDVVVPCYNYGRYLGECIDSILGQEGCELRVLVIDDASTDGSAEIARALAARDPRVEVVVHAKNMGHVATFNEGIAWAQRTYFLLISADDVLAPGALQRAADLMEAHPGVAFVHGTAIRFRGERPAIRADIAPAPPRIVPGARFIAAICADPVNPVDTATAVVRTSVQKQVGLYKDELPHAGDLEMWLRCAAVGDVGEIDALQAYRRLHDGSLSAHYTADGLMFDFLQRYDTFRIFFTEHGRVLPDGKRLVTLANRRLADQIAGEALAQLRRGRGGAALQLMRFACRIAPGLFLTGRWWRRVAGGLWRAVRRGLAAL
jgi:glycosyltransferase involved in cell wall biosynthesis